MADYGIAALASAVLALQAQSSRSTIDRLAKRFGFGGFRDFGLALLGESRAMQSAIAVGPAPTPALTTNDTLGEIACKVFHTASVRALRFAEVLSRTPDLDRPGRGSEGHRGEDRRSRLDQHVRGLAATHVASCAKLRRGTLSRHELSAIHLQDLPDDVARKHFGREK